MELRKVNSKQFNLRKEAVAWAKDEKSKMGKALPIKWETNRTDNPNKPWEAVIYRKV
jgi:hypothetical protein